MGVDETGSDSTSLSGEHTSLLRSHFTDTRRASGPILTQQSTRTMLGEPTVSVLFERTWQSTLSQVPQASVSIPTWESYLGLSQTVIPSVKHSFMRTARIAFAAGVLATGAGFFWYSGGYRAYTEGAEDLEHLMRHYSDPSPEALEALTWLLVISTVFGNLFMPLVSVITQSLTYRDAFDRFFGDKLAPSPFTEPPDSSIIPWYSNPKEMAKYAVFFISAVASSLMELGIALTPETIMTPMLYAKVVFVALFRFHLSFASLWAIEKTFIKDEAVFYNTTTPAVDADGIIKERFIAYLQQFQARAVFLDPQQFAELANKKIIQLDCLAKFAPLYSNSSLSTKKHVLQELQKTGLILLQETNIDDFTLKQVNAYLNMVSMRLFLQDFTEMIPSFQSLPLSAQLKIIEVLTPNNQLPRWQHPVRYGGSTLLLSSSAAGVINAEDGASIVTGALGLVNGVLQYILAILASITICTLALRFTLDAGRITLKTSLPFVSLQANKMLWVLLIGSVFFNLLSFGVAAPAAKNAVGRYLNGNLTETGNFTLGSDSNPYQDPDQGWGLFFIAWIAIFSVINNIIVTMLGILRLAQFFYETRNSKEGFFIRLTNFAKDALNGFRALSPQKVVDELCAWYTADPDGMNQLLKEAGLVEADGTSAFFDFVNNGITMQRKATAQPPYSLVIPIPPPAPVSAPIAIATSAPASSSAATSGRVINSFNSFRRRSLSFNNRVDPFDDILYVESPDTSTGPQSPIEADPEDTRVPPTPPTERTGLLSQPQITIDPTTGMRERTRAPQKSRCNIL